MSRSAKDGRHGGGHRPQPGKEYGTPRGEPMMVPGRRAKTRTHSMERAARRRTEHDAMSNTTEEEDMPSCATCGVSHADPEPCANIVAKEREIVEDYTTPAYEDWDFYDEWEFAVRRY